jgi:hypothetical protein
MMMKEDAPGLAQVSIANLGFCGKFHDQCEDRVSLEQRCLIDPGED